jgi:saccharopine dehydrogenase-like NADP-dependent oxidoreductase
MLVYEGVKAKKFFPFWWSPVVAYGDMVERPYNLIDGKIESVDPFGGMIEREVRGIDGKKQFYDHLHDEALLIGMHPDFHLGCKNAAFKYGGFGVDFSKNLYDMGMLSPDSRVVDGKAIIPFDMMVGLTPPAPKYHDEIAAILDEGLESDTGAMLVEAFGWVDGKPVMVETYVMAPGCVDAFGISGLTGETYLTGQGGYLFTELLVEGKIQQIGAMGPDQLTMDQVGLYLEKASALDIKLETQVIEQTPESPGYAMCGSPSS